MTATARWPEAMASVTACEYNFGAGQALAFGIPSSKHFRIFFNYRVNGELHTGQLYSAVALPQGHLFPLRYNPVAPHEHNPSASPPTRKTVLFAIGVAGSVVLSLLWLAMVRGCH